MAEASEDVEGLEKFTHGEGMVSSDDAFLIGSSTTMQDLPGSAEADEQPESGSEPLGVRSVSSANLETSSSCDHFESPLKGVGVIGRASS